MSYGFIITRHVNSETTNKYWNHCIQCIRRFYSPEKYKIIVIDDNSNKEFLKEDFEYKNIQYIQSEFIGRGELLPYYYFYKNHFFDNAVIIHDSVFFYKKIKFTKILAPILPLWHFTEEKLENVTNSIKLSSFLKNNYLIQRKLYNSNKYEILSLNNTNSEWCGCFGLQSYINYNFLVKIQNKYNLFNLLNAVKNRNDRCCLERIFGVIFFNEFPDLIKIKSLMGNITSYCQWGYSWKNYCEDMQKYKKSNKPLIKVWTGR